MVVLKRCRIVCGQDFESSSRAGVDLNKCGMHVSVEDEIHTGFDHELGLWKPVKCICDVHN
jgi:hypothetical protein